MYNPDVVLLISSAKSYNYKYKTSKNLTKKSLPTIHLMAYVATNSQWTVSMQG